MQFIKRPITRLSPDSYRDEGLPALVTFCAKARGSDILTRCGMAELIAAEIRAAVLDVEVYVWCVMPDHVHAIVRPLDGGDVIAWVRRVKGRVATQARSRGYRALWQRSFHDRLIRSELDLVPALRYVLDNPVRAGLVASWEEWPHSGSQTWDLSTL